MKLSQTELDDRIYSIGSAIPLRCFQIIPAVVFGMAMFSAIARSIMRLWTRRPFYWDDLVLAIGAASFIASTVLLHKTTYYQYLAHALQEDIALDFEVPPSDLLYTIGPFVDQYDAWLAVTWTTIFCVKASFLIISKQLLHRLKWLNIYFWFVVVFTVVSWALIVSSTFIECPLTGFARVSCNESWRSSLQFGFSSLVAGLDILTDIMTASIPVTILWRSKLDRKQKFIIAPFLCLSLVMIAFSVVRVSKTRYINDTDFAWITFWQYLEGGVAIIVTSITTVRTVFTARKQQSSKKAHSYGISNDTNRSQNTHQDTITNLPEAESQAVAVTEPCEIVVQSSWDISYTQEAEARKSETDSDEPVWPSQPTTFFVF